MGTRRRRGETERRLSDVVCGRIAFGEPLARHTTLGVGGPADVIVFPSTVDELRGVLRIAGANEMPLLALGAGADLIVRDGGWRGVCVAIARNLKGLAISGDGRAIDAMGGETFAALLGLAREASLTGLEFLATVPGTVGGGVATNVGAFGVSFADRLDAVWLLDGAGRSIRVGREGLDPRYRAIPLPAGSIVTRARFLLEPARPGVVEENVRRFRERRLRTQPLRRASAGCVFRNPSATEYAGRLIDRAGLKGLAIGGASVSERHGNFIVNDGGATAADVLRLIDEIRRRVGERFGIDLEPEVRIVGEP